MAGKKQLKREHFCGKINTEFIDQELSVYGWVHNKRELGGLTFIDLRDREGILQIVINESFSNKDLIKKIGREYVLYVRGDIKKRSNPNPELKTGEVELIAREIEILAESELPPFFPGNVESVSEELRYKYRYLDLRNEKMQRNFKLRNDVCHTIRNYLKQEGFFDIETPMLTKATPEGARDYLVPSRVYPGRFFALPQSPQLFKQLLMVSGFERYYQITKCFRDEDLRADRQPEFTQIDVEMSFAEPEQLFNIIEGMMAEVFALTGNKVSPGFKVKTYQEVMEKYGTDKPDLRIPWEIADFSQSCRKLGSNILESIITNNGVIKGLVLPERENFSRKKLDEINNYIRELKGQGVIWIKKGDQGFKSSLKIEADKLEDFYQENDLDPNHIVFLIGGEPKNTLMLTGKLREFLGTKFQDRSTLEFLWVIDFPLFFYNEDEKRFDSNHHPFTSPKLEDLDKLDSDPLAVNSIAYDLVLNGVEIAGGSRRINNIDLQKKIFELLNLSHQEIEEKFGFFLKALSFGAPPHLGIAFGLDRVVMLLSGEDSIREIIAFPKTTSSLCLLTGSPSSVSEHQLSELGIKTKGDSK